MGYADRLDVASESHRQVVHKGGCMEAAGPVLRLRAWPDTPVTATRSVRPRLARDLNPRMGLDNWELSSRRRCLHSGVSSAALATLERGKIANDRLVRVSAPCATATWRYACSLIDEKAYRRSRSAKTERGHGKVRQHAGCEQYFRWPELPLTRRRVEANGGILVRSWRQR